MTFFEFRANYFSRWLRRLVIECWAILLLSSVFSAIFYWLYKVNGDGPKNIVLLSWWIELFVPFMLQLFALLFMHLLLRLKHNSKIKKTRIVLVTMFVILSIMSFFYWRFEVLYICPFFAVIMAAILCERNLVYLFSFFSFAVFFISNIFFFRFYDINTFTLDRNIQIFIQFMIMIGFFFLSIGCYSIQNLHLRYLFKNYKKQKRLISELKLELLTRLYNRTAYEIAIKNMMKNYRQTKSDMFQILLDLDNFKKVNDSYGHSRGDAVLIYFADLIKKVLGSSRLAFRYGGDEFIILFREKTIEEVVFIVDYIRNEFNNAIFDFMKDTEHCSMSIGIAQYQDGWSSQQWFSAADSAAYKAKSKGKNCYEIYRNGE